MKKKHLLIVGTLMLALCVGSSAKAYNEPPEKSEKEQLKQIAERIEKRIEQDIAAEEQLREDASDVERTDVSGDPGICFNQILDYIRQNPDSALTKGFAGAYYYDNETLAVMLSAETEACREELKALNIEAPCVFLEGNGSYQERQQTLEAMNGKVIAWNQAVSQGKELDEDQEKLAALYPRVIYEDLTNTIAVILAEPQEVLEAVKKAQEEETLNEQEKADLAAFEEGIALFKQVIGDFPDVVYRADTEDAAQMIPANTEVPPGCGIWIGNIGPFSLGYRAYYFEDENEYYGFLTCAHRNHYGDRVRVVFGSQVYEIGFIMRRAYGGYVDAAFVTLNLGYTRGSRVYYSDTMGTTGQGTVLDGTQTSVSYNQIIYKSGATTFLTGGRVENTYFSIYVDGLYFTGLIVANTAMVEQGDSGGVTFVVPSGTVYGKAVGIVEGFLDPSGKAVFVSADKIMAYFGPEAY